jgi:hypothetical protein
VSVGSVTQVQAGALNSQSVEIGNNSGSGTSKVSVGNVTQVQSGVLGNGKVRIGNK